MLGAKVRPIPHLGSKSLKKITVCWRQSSVGGNDFLHGHPGAGKIDGELKLDSTDDHGEILMK